MDRRGAVVLGCSHLGARRRRLAATVTSGPRPGPDILYEPPADAPQLTRTPVSGARSRSSSPAPRAYRDGEFVYQDFLYDDHGARRRPARPQRPALGRRHVLAAERHLHVSDRRQRLRAERGRPRRAARASRSPTPPRSGSRSTPCSDDERGGDHDRDRLHPAAPRQYPHGAGVSGARPAVPHRARRDGRAAQRRHRRAGAQPAPTVDGRPRPPPDRDPRPARARGTRARPPSASRRASGCGTRRTTATSLPAASDRDARPGGAGDARPARRRSSTSPSAPTSRCPDVATPRHRRHRPRVVARPAAGARAARAATSPRFHADVDFAKLAAGDARRLPACPQTGPINRILASHYEPAQGVDFRTRELRRSSDAAARASCSGACCPTRSTCRRRRSRRRLRPHACCMHSLGANYNQYSAQPQPVASSASAGPARPDRHALGARAGRLVRRATPARTSFEVWADVARHYQLDPALTSIAGYSMGGYGTYQFATAVPRPLRQGPADGRPARRSASRRRRATRSPAGAQSNTYPPCSRRCGTSRS